jgi:hypothetical protein
VARVLPPVIEAARVFRNQLLRAERTAATQLVNAYGLAYQRLQGDIAALTAAMTELGAPTAGQVARMTLFRSLLASIEREVSRYAILAESEINAGALAAIERGLANSSRLVQLSLPGLDVARLEGIFVRLHPEAVLNMVGFLQESSPLYVNLSKLGPAVAETVKARLLEGIALGYNPRRTAALIRQTAGQGLTWSLNTARTAQLYAYREASRTNYVANSHVVRGWVWFAQLDNRVCLSCVNQHGGEHAADETLADHHSGRCAMVPQTVSYRELGFNVPNDETLRVQRGEAWFTGLSAQEQRERMGPAMWEAWRAGKFDFRDLSQPYTDSVYGEMLREASLKGLLGNQAQAFYRQ